MLAYILFSNWSVPQETVLNKIKQKQWGLKSNHCDTGVQKKMFAFGQNNQKKVESWKNVCFFEQKKPARVRLDSKYFTPIILK